MCSFERPAPKITSQEVCGTSTIGGVEKSEVIETDSSFYVCASKAEDDVVIVKSETCRINTRGPILPSIHPSSNHCIMDLSNSSHSIRYCRCKALHIARVDGWSSQYRYLTLT